MGDDIKPHDLGRNLFVYDQSSYPANADSEEEEEGGETESSDQPSDTSSKGYATPVQNVECDNTLDEHDDTLCAVCAEVLVDPCTLHCGHSFCQLCLASIWKNSSNKSPLHLECPACRQPWVNFPGVNIQLRNIIERTHEKLVSLRRAERSVSDDGVIGMFNQAKEGEMREKRQGTVNNNIMRRRWFVIGVAVLFSLFAVITVLVLISFMLVLSGASRDFMRKPVSRWNNKDVVDWVEGLGEWTVHNNISRIFSKEKISGAQLLLLDKPALNIIGIHMEFQVKSLLLKIDELKQQDYSTPRDFPEFMAAHRKNTVLVGVMYRLWPRFTLLYIYVFEHYDIFIPIWQYSARAHQPQEGEQEEQDDEKDYKLFSRELILFGLQLILVPHYVIGMFAWHWFNLHPWICTAVIIHCIWTSQKEAKSVLNYMMSVNQLRVKMSFLIRMFFKSGLQFVLSVSGGLMVWPFIPYFLCDFLLYLVIWNTVYTQLIIIPFKLFTARRQGLVRINLRQEFMP